MGWNTLSATKGALFENIAANEYMYLVHSYYAPLIEETIAATTYGETYSTALQKENFYGVQFHPEKSSKAGSQLLSNFFSLMRIIPAIDIIDGKCVRLSKGDYSTQNLQ